MISFALPSPFPNPFESLYPSSKLPPRYPENRIPAIVETNQPKDPPRLQIDHPPEQWPNNRAERSSETVVGCRWTVATSLARPLSAPPEAAADPEDPLTRTEGSCGRRFRGVSLSTAIFTGRRGVGNAVCRNFLFPLGWPACGVNSTLRWPTYPSCGLGCATSTAGRGGWRRARETTVGCVWIGRQRWQEGNGAHTGPPLPLCAIK